MSLLYYKISFWDSAKISDITFVKTNKTKKLFQWEKVYN